MILNDLVKPIIKTDDLYENISIKLPSKSYAMLEVLSTLTSKPKTSMLTSDISKKLSDIIETEEELVDLIEETLNEIPLAYCRESFLQLLIDKGIVYFK